MNGIDEQLSEREEIEMLLPWYTTGRLDAADTARVDAYLTRHPDVRRQLALIAEEQTATIAGNEAIMPRLASADMLLARTSTPASAARSWLSGMVDAVKELFSAPTPGAVRWAAAAAVVVIFVQALAVGTLLTREGGSYQTASRPGVEAQLAPVATIAFTDNASVGAIAMMLYDQQLRLVDGPLPGGFYSVRFVDRPSSAEQERRLAAVVNRKDLVKAVLPSR